MRLHTFWTLAGRLPESVTEGWGWRSPLVAIAERGGRLAGAILLDAGQMVNSTGRRNTSTVRSCDGNTDTSTVTPGGTSSTAVAWSSDGGTPGAPAAVLGSDRRGAVQRRGCGGGGRIPAGGNAMVPPEWRHAAHQPGPPVGALFVVGRARRHRHLARPARGDS